jgi:hypothetical protein
MEVSHGCFVMPKFVALPLRVYATSWLWPTLLSPSAVKASFFLSSLISRCDPDRVRERHLQPRQAHNQEMKPRWSSPMEPSISTTTPAGEELWYRLTVTTSPSSSEACWCASSFACTSLKLMVSKSLSLEREIMTVFFLENQGPDAGCRKCRMKLAARDLFFYF